MAADCLSKAVAGGLCLDLSDVCDALLQVLDGAPCIHLNRIRRSLHIDSHADLLAGVAGDMCGEMGVDMGV